MCEQWIQRYNKYTKRSHLIPCGVCKQCLWGKVTDLAGRMTAESKMHGYSYAVTLTYANGVEDNYLYPRPEGVHENDRSQLLHYSDVQVYLKRLRNSAVRSGGHDVEVLHFVAAGEYGDLKGRAHWHLLLFFDSADDLPANIVESRRGCPVRFNHIDERGLPYWGPRESDRHWGFSHWLPFDAGSAAYVAKYMNKPGGKFEGFQKQLRKSNGLGSMYFRKLAYETAQQGLPCTRYYYFEEHQLPKNYWRKDDNVRGHLRRYQLYGADLERFYRDYLEAWSIYWPWRSYPRTADGLLEDFDENLIHEKLLSEKQPFIRDEDFMNRTRLEHEQKRFGVVRSNTPPALFDELGVYGEKGNREFTIIPPYRVPVLPVTRSPYEIVSRGR